MRKCGVNSSLFTEKQKKRGECSSSALGKMMGIVLRIGGFCRDGQFSHCRNQTEIRAARRTLHACKSHGGFRSGAAMIFFRAEQTDAFGVTGVINFHRDRLVPGNFLFDRLNHSAFTAFRTAGCDDLLCDDVVTAGSDLARFGVVVSGA